MKEGEREEERERKRKGERGGRGRRGDEREIFHLLFSSPNYRTARTRSAHRVASQEPEQHFTAFPGVLLRSWIRIQQPGLELLLPSGYQYYKWQLY